MKKMLAVAVRPYSGPLRQKVFRLLSGLGVEVQAPTQLGDGTSNQEAIGYLRTLRPNLLLIPFHVVRTEDGGRTSGLGLLAQLRREAPRFRETRVIMPVSVFARLAFDTATRNEPQQHVFPLVEEEIDREATGQALERFLSEDGSTTASKGGVGDGLDQGR